MPIGGDLQLEDGGVLTGFVVTAGGTITRASIIVNTADGANSYKLSIRVNGVEVSSVTLASGSTKNQSSVLSSAVVAGDIVTAYMTRTAGAGASAFNSMAAVVVIT